MNEMLEQEIVETRAPITITLRDGRKLPIAFHIGAVIAFRKQTGLDLFNKETWKDTWKKLIDPSLDPEIFLAGVWSSLHQLDEAKILRSPITLGELSVNLDFGNLAPTSQAIAQALTMHMPKTEGDASPNELTAESQVA